MGTRTYSRRGVLTAAGRRRAGLEAIDIFGNVIPNATPPVVEQPAPTQPVEPVLFPPRSTVPPLDTNAAKAQRKLVSTNTSSSTDLLDIGDNMKIPVIELTPEQQKSLDANSFFDYRLPPDFPPPGEVTPQGPMQIDMARMSPVEITDRIIKFAKDNPDMSQDKYLDAMFASMRHPNGASTVLQIDAPDGTPVDTIENVQRIANGMWGMVDESKMNFLSLPNGRKVQPTLKINLTKNISRFLAQYSPLQMQTGAYSGHRIEMYRDISSSVMMHELAHALDSLYPQVAKMNQTFARKRVEGLPQDYKTDSYKERNASNHVDNPYTLSGEKGRYPEVFSTGFESILNARNIGDRQLIEHTIRAIQTANGYYNTRVRM